MAEVAPQPDITTTSNPAPATEQPFPPLKTRSITIRAPPHTYIHITLTAALPSPPPPQHPQTLDILTARTHLTSALQQHLGLTGTAIPIDFLKVEGRSCWIRCPREDGASVVGALSAWIGRGEGAGEKVAWRVGERGEWLSCVHRGGGEELFAR